MAIWRVRNACQIPKATPHTHTHTHTHTITHTHTNTHTLTHTNTLTQALTHTLTQTHTHTVTHSHTLSHTHTLTYKHTHTHTRSHTHTLTDTHTRTLTLTNTHSQYVILIAVPQQHARTSLLRYKYIARPVITQMQCVYCAVRTACVNTNQVTVACTFAAGSSVGERQDQISLYPFPCFFLYFLTFFFFL